MTRRATIAALLVMTLTACLPTSRDAPEVPVMTLDGGGIEPGVTRLRIDFGRAQIGVIETVSRLLGERPASVVPNTGCGAGDVVRAVWSDGLTLYFEDGNFAGWVNRDASLPTVGGIRPGQARLELPPVSFQVNRRGTEFTLGAVTGLLDETDTRVVRTYAGQACLAPRLVAAAPGL